MSHKTPLIYLDMFIPALLLAPICKQALNGSYALPGFQCFSRLCGGKAHSVTGTGNVSWKVMHLALWISSKNPLDWQSVSQQV